MKRVIASALAITVVFGFGVMLTACGDGDGDGLTCGTGTVEQNGECVPPCPAGQHLVGSECVDIPECSNGTELDPETGECVAVCAEGTTYNEETGQCDPEELTCGDGTHFDNGECVPDCAIGETWNGTECVEICGEGTTLNPDTGVCEPDQGVVCGEGTHLDENGECVPNVLPDPMVPEDESLVPGPEFTLPDVGPENAVSLGGTIGAPDDGPDFDAFYFITTDGGVYLRLWATSEGACLPAFMVVGVDSATFALGPDAWSVFYHRVGLNPNGLEAAREVYLPMAGTYVIYVSDYNNLINELFDYGYVPVGGDDFTYYMTVERLADPAFNPIDMAAPATQSGSFDDGLGFFSLSNLPGVDEVVHLFSTGEPDPLGSDVVSALMLFAPDGSFVKEIQASNTSTDANLLFLTASAGAYTVVQDYILSIGPMRDYELDAAVVPYTDMDTQTPPVDLDLPAGEEQLLSWSLTAGQAGIFAVYAPDNSKELEVTFFDGDLNLVAEASTEEDNTAHLWPAFGFIYAPQDMLGFVLVTEASGQAVGYSLDFVIVDTPELTDGANPGIPTTQMPPDSFHDAGIAHFAGAAGDMVFFSDLVTNDPPKAWISPSTSLLSHDGVILGPIWDVVGGAAYTDEAIAYLPADGDYLHWTEDTDPAADIIGGSYDVTMATTTPLYAGAVTESQDIDVTGETLDPIGWAAFTFMPEDVQIVEVSVTPTGGATMRPEVWVLHFGDLLCGVFACLWTPGSLGARLGLGADATAPGAGQAAVVRAGLPYMGLYVVMVRDAGSGGAADTFDLNVTALESPCLNPTEIVLDGNGHAELTGDNTGGENLIGGLNACTDWESNGPEAYYSLDLTAGDQVVIMVDTVDVEYTDYSLYVISDCLDPANSCVAGNDDTVLPEVVNFTASYTGTYIVVVDGFSDQDHAPFTMTVDVN